MAKRIRAVLSDIGNVVAYFDNNRTFQGLAEACGLDAVEVERVIMDVGKPLLDDFERGEVDAEEFQSRTLRRLNLSKAEWPTAEEFLRHYNDVFTVNEPVLNHWKRLRADGLLLAAVSNICPPRFGALQDLGAFSPFHQVLASCEEGLRKPSEELLVRALDRLGVDAEEAIYVDDIEEFLAPAQALGIHAHQYVNHASFVAFLRRHSLLP